MKFRKTKRRFPAFIALIEKCKNESMKKRGYRDVVLSKWCDEKLLTVSLERPQFIHQKERPFFYLFNLNGATYVLEENEFDDASVVYEITEHTKKDKGSICKQLLRQTLDKREGDNNVWLADYGLRANPTLADKDTDKVSIWIEYNFELNGTEFASKIDGYLMYENEKSSAIVFDGLEKAQECILNLRRESYLLDDFEVGRPTYLCVAA